MIDAWLAGLLASDGSFAGALLTRLVSASASGLLLGSLAFGIIRLWPSLRPSWQCALWWAVGVKFLVALLWFAPLEVPLLSAPSGAAEAALVRDLPLTEAALATGAQTDRAAEPPAPAPGLPWRSAILAVWLMGVLVGAAGIVRELLVAGRLRRGSRPIAERAVHELFASVQRRLGVRGRVALRCSDDIDGPLTLGWLRPLVLLPASATATLGNADLAMVLGHELVHVRRRDLWTAWVPRLSRCLFFFHPLATVAARGYAQAREAACDAAVVRELQVAPLDYGRLLVRWRPSRGRSALNEGVGCAAASATFRNLKGRLEMLERPPTAPRRLHPIRWLAVMVLLIAVLPLRIVAQQSATTRPTDSASGVGAFERAVTVSGRASLDLRNGSGSVVVRRGAPGTVRIKGRITARSGFFRSGSARERAETVRRLETNPPIDVSGNIVRVGHVEDDSRQQVSISYEVEVPNDTEIRSATGSGQQSVAGVSGPVHVRTGSGSIALVDIGGPVDASTGSGSIRADRIAGSFKGHTGSGSVDLLQTAPGDVDVATGSGSSTLRGIHGALRVRTGSGGITVEGRPTGPWDLEAGSGSVELQLAADAGFELDARTGSGRIDTGVPVTLKGEIDPHRLVAQVRGGGPLLRARTGSGGVRIR